MRRKENAPSRWRPRPASRLTTAEATTTRRAINLRRSVLGASGTLWTGRLPVKHPYGRSAQFAERRPRGACTRALSRRGTSPRTQKCTEPVAPSSGFPTDRRRSDCRSESHQPLAFRTRCIAHSREHPRARQGVRDATSRKLRSFLFATPTLRPDRCALSAREKKNGRARRARPQRFAEPGTLSSTFPTNLPLPRSAPRGASSYRRPVLGAGRNLWQETCPIKGVQRRNFSQFAAALSH